MTPPTSVTVPVETITVEAKLPADHAACATVVQSPPSPEQVRASEAVFAQQEKEANFTMGLLGVWTSTVLLHDLALEHFWSNKTDDEEELDEQQKKKLLLDGMPND